MYIYLLQTDHLPTPQIVADVKAVNSSLRLKVYYIRALSDGGALFSKVEGGKWDNQYINMVMIYVGNLHFVI